MKRRLEREIDGGIWRRKKLGLEREEDRERDCQNEIGRDGSVSSAEMWTRGRDYSLSFLCDVYNEVHEHK